MVQQLTSLLQYNSISLVIQFSATAHPILQYNPLLQYNFPSLAIQCHQTTHPDCNTIFFYCNTIPSQLHPSLAIQLQYNFSSPLSCNTIAMLQYMFFFHNTIWAVAHPNFCCIFFSFFFLIFFFTLISSYWKHPKTYPCFFFTFSAIEDKNLLKIYIKIFFFFHYFPIHQINLVKFIYLIFFSFSSTPK